MNVFVKCPGCGFRGQLPGALSGIKTIVCPNCKTAVPFDQLRQHAAPPADDALPIWVDSVPTGGAAPPVSEPAVYSGSYMKDEAARFAEYVAARLGELHARRRELAEAECRFESMTMERKQELFRVHGGVTVGTERLKERESALQAKEADLAARGADLAAREADLVAREADLVAREARVARVESRAADTDRRTAELRATIDQLDATRAALAEERAELARSADALACRAEALDRAELALHRRFAELDELVS